MNRIRLGFLTPSSNTTLEPVTAAMLAGVEGVSAHFGRFQVTEITLSPRGLAQFDKAPILEAARLLSHARVQAIVWNGTSSGWLGFKADEELCAAISAATGIPAGTSMLALNVLLERLGARTLGLVTPYTEDVEAAIIRNYQGLGIACAGAERCGISENFAFAEVPEARIEAMIRAVAARKPDAIAVVCTNLRAAPLVARLEAELGIPILDTIATAVWDGLRLAGGDPARVQGWGRLFSLR